MLNLHCRLWVLDQVHTEQASEHLSCVLSIEAGNSYPVFCEASDRVSHGRLEIKENG